VIRPYGILVAVCWRLLQLGVTNYKGTPASSIGAEELTSVVMSQGLVVLVDEGREEVEV
jgi:hypothetical protein